MDYTKQYTFDELVYELNKEILNICDRCKDKEQYTIHSPMVFRRMSTEPVRGYFATKSPIVGSNGLCLTCTRERNKIEYDQENGKSFE